MSNRAPINRRVFYYLPADVWLLVSGIPWAARFRGSIPVVENLWNIG